MQMCAFFYYFLQSSLAAFIEYALVYSQIIFCFGIVV